MSTLVTALLVFFGAAGLGLLIMQPILASYTQNYMMRVRIRANRDSLKSVGNASLAAPAAQLCKAIGVPVLKLVPQLGGTRIKQALIEANFRQPDHLPILVGAKVLCFALPVLLISMQGISALTVLMAITAGFFGWTLPNYSVFGRARRRKQELFRELPTLLDLMVVCARAGLGLLACLDQVAQSMTDTCPLLKEELDQTLVDVKVFAHPLRPALEDFSARCGVEELNNLTSALVMSEQKGSNISDTLAKQSDAIRDRIKRKAEEQASTIPVKMVPIIILFILPLMLIPTLGVVGMQLANILQHMLEGFR